MTNYNDNELTVEQTLTERFFATELIELNNFSQKEQDVRKIAASLFVNYFDSETADEMLFGPYNDESIIQDHLEKAEKIYDIAGSYDSAVLILNFLKTIKLDIAKQVVASI